ALAVAPLTVPVGVALFRGDAGRLVRVPGGVDEQVISPLVPLLAEGRAAHADDGDAILDAVACHAGLLRFRYSARRGGDATAAESEASPVEGHRLEGAEVDAVEAAHVDHSTCGARLVAAEGERRAATGRTEVMPDLAAPEGVGRQLGLRRGQTQLIARPHPEEVAALRADRAVALHDLVEIAVDLERDPSAVTSALLDHARAVARVRALSTR